MLPLHTGRRSTIRVDGAAQQAGQRHPARVVQRHDEVGARQGDVGPHPPGGVEHPAVAGAHLGQDAAAAPRAGPAPIRAASTGRRPRRARVPVSSAMPGGEHRLARAGDAVHEHPTTRPRLRSVLARTHAVRIGDDGPRVRARRPGPGSAGLYAGPMVNLTRIYTRTGDAGTTRLGDNSETTKTDLRLEAYADVDELNSHLGHALAAGGLDERVVAVLVPRAERPVRRRRRPRDPRRGRAGVPAAARAAGVRRPPRGLVRRVQRAARGAPLVHPARRHPRRRAAARVPHRGPPRGAGRLARPRRARRRA